jgi:hypothetical protein
MSPEEALHPQRPELYPLLCLLSRFLLAGADKKLGKKKGPATQIGTVGLECVLVVTAQPSVLSESNQPSSFVPYMKIA